MGKLHDELVRQARIKIDRRLAPDPSAPAELVSDVYFSIIEKLDNSQFLKRMVETYEKGQLLAYLGKAIDVNARFLNAPFLKSKIKQKNRIVIETSGSKYRQRISEPAFSEDEQKALDIIEECMEPQRAKELLGPHWKYYTTILEEYIKEPDISYQDLADHYGIRKRTLGRDIRIIKGVLKQQIYRDVSIYN